MTVTGVAKNTLIRRGHILEWSLVSELMKQWTIALREAMAAEDAVKAAAKGQMQQSPELVEMHRKAQELKEKADALFRQLQRRGES